MSKTEMSLSKNYRDVQGKTIFHDPFLCAQFLRNNVDNPILKKVQPEDIEDFTEKFRPYFGVEFEGDTIKRICIKSDNEKYHFYLISLIEHKSSVDYNITIQLLKYMVCIWTRYEEEFGEEYKERIRNKSFHYPPIIPIVYYEGKGEWTVSRHLRDRIHMADFFEEYIPDFVYELVDIHKISNQELLQRKDIMSLIMLLNKIQTPEDLSEVSSISVENMGSILDNSPQQVIDILISVIRTLCKRIHATPEETEGLVEKVRSGDMGYLFENMEPMDIQAERRKTAQAKAEVEELNQKLSGTEERLSNTKEQLLKTHNTLLQKEARILELENMLRSHGIKE